MIWNAWEPILLGPRSLSYFLFFQNPYSLLLESDPIGSLCWFLCRDYLKVRCSMQADYSTLEHEHGQQLNESQIHHWFFQYPEDFPCVNKLAMISVFSSVKTREGHKSLSYATLILEVWQTRKASVVLISVQLVVMLHCSTSRIYCSIWRCDLIFIVWLFVHQSNMSILLTSFTHCLICRLCWLYSYICHVIAVSWQHLI